MTTRTLVTLQSLLYEFMPRWLRVPLNHLRVVPSYLNWLMSAQGKRHAEEVLAELKGRFDGCRCVVLGNGPSLKQMDLALMESEFTFGLNRIYLLFEQIGFETTFLVSVNRFVIGQFGSEMAAASGLKVFSWKHGRAWQGQRDILLLPAKPFATMNGEMTRGYFNGGGTVTNVALELAFYLGFSEVLLVGVDHSYSEDGPAGKPVEADRPDADHFSNQYFGPGVTWQLPNFEAMEEGYRMARDLFVEDNRVIYDGTVGGQLHVFEKVNYKRYLESSEAWSKARWVSEFGQSLPAANVIGS